jgi:hypothetical protein
VTKKKSKPRLQTQAKAPPPCPCLFPCIPLQTIVIVRFHATCSLHFVGVATSHHHVQQSIWTSRPLLFFSFFDSLLSMSVVTNGCRSDCHIYRCCVPPPTLDLYYRHFLCLFCLLLPLVFPTSSSCTLVVVVPCAEF